jgi:hypothetical protein
MITAAQAAIAAYETEFGEIYCDCCWFDNGGKYARPVSQFEVDERQSSYANGYEWDEDDHPTCNENGCEPALYCDGCGDELAPEWHDDPEPEDREPNETHVDA